MDWLGKGERERETTRVGSRMGFFVTAEREEETATRVECYSVSSACFMHRRTTRAAGGREEERERATRAGNFLASRIIFALPAF